MYKFSKHTECYIHFNNKTLRDKYWMPVIGMHSEGLKFADICM